MPSTGPYEQHRGYVLGVLARRCGWLEADEREAIFHDAFVVMLEKERSGELEVSGMAAGQVRAYLTQAAIYRALDEGKRAERKRSEPLGEGAFAAPDPGAAPDELADMSLDSARVREIVAGLPQRRQVIVKLRFFLDRTPQEIEGYLGISERVYRRELERALQHIAERYDLVRRGTFCDSRRSLILAFVAGIAGPNRAREARDHLAACPACAHWAAELRETTQRVAEILPLPALAQEQGLLTRAAEVASGVREGLGGLSGSVREQAAAVIARVDPSGPQYAAVTRPGAAAAAVASCLAIGGGATYCVVEGIPEPVRAVLPPLAEKPERARVERKPRARPSPTATLTPEPVRAPEPTRTPEARRAASSPQRTPEPTRAPTPAPPPTAREFGLPGAGQRVSPSRAGAPPPAAAPKPRPSGPPGEFDP